ncbi:MAG: hypothetical protein ACPF9D_06815, partial [Owenweeksia sp.]
MKKFTLLFLVVTAALSCKKDDGGGPSEPPYPTDDLVLEEKTNSLMLMPYAPGDKSKLPNQVFCELLEYEYEGTFSHLNIVTGMGHPFNFPVADSIATHFGYPKQGIFTLNGQVLDPEEVPDVIELTELEKPTVAVAHKVMDTDTAWVVDAKVKFLRDTSSVNFTIETYMILDVPAEKYDKYDLRYPKTEGVTDLNDDFSFWIKNIVSFDSTETVIAANDPYIHHNILYKNFNSRNSFGTKLSEINPLGGEFFKNDVYGTRFTPIRHYFKKP